MKKKYIWIFVFPKLFIPSPIRIGEGRKLYLCSHLAILKLVRLSYPMCDEQNYTGEDGQADRVPAGASSRLPGLPGLNSQPQPQLSVGAVPGRQWQWHSSTGSQQPHGTHGLSCQFLAFSCPVLGHWDLWSDLVDWRGEPLPKINKLKKKGKGKEVKSWKMVAAWGWKNDTTCLLFSHWHQEEGVGRHVCEIVI